MAKFLKNHLTIVLVLLFSLLVGGSLPFVAGKNVTIPFILVPTPTLTPAPLATTVLYKGEQGKDALTILKAKTTVELAASGLVVSINGRKADDKKHEYWAFYVNNKYASVGPKDYQTKDTDQIVWKIEKY